MDLLKEAIKNTPQKTPLYVKIFSLFSVVRGYNIALLVLAQYLTAIFIFSPNHSIQDTLLNPQLYFIVFSTICVVAGGYIINNFYDAEADSINRPLRHKIDNIVSQKIQLTIYFTLNFLGVFVAFLVSIKAALFFSAYIFGIWLYSHKLKKYPLAGFLTAPVLTILPFFAIFVYYRNFSEVIFINATFLFYILLIKELIKQLKTLKGNFVFNYQTIAVKYGEKFTKMLVTILSVLTIIPLYFLLKHPELGGMKYYYYAAIPLLFLFNVILWFTKTTQGYSLLDFALKLFILTGVFSIITI